jgi:outer membrane protein assembly factor BamB
MKMKMRMNFIQCGIMKLSVLLTYTYLACLVPAWTASTASAADQGGAESYWHQWRGPTANGVALHGNPPVEWSEDNNIKWKVRIPGQGHATPVVWGDKIFVLTAVPTGKKSQPSAETPAEIRASRGSDDDSGDRRRGRRGRGRFGRDTQPSEEYAFTTLCLDRQTGQVIWEQVGRKEVPHEGHQSNNTFSSGSPVTDGNLLYSFFGSRGLYCYDLEGNLQWEKDLGDMETRLGFGEGSSPALHGDTLIVLWDHEGDSYVYALNAKTGKELWKQSRDERTGWSTPYIFEHNGTKQVAINASNKVRCYELASGKLLWECSGQTANAIPSIVGDADTHYAMSGFRGNKALAIELGHTGDLTGTGAIRWEMSRGTPYVPSPLLYDGYLYFSQGNNNILSCIDAAAGKPFYTQERLPEISDIYASPVGANNRVYIVGRGGTTLVLEKSEELNVLATNKLDDRIDASPVVVGNELYLRGYEHLYCIAEN